MESVMLFTLYSNGCYFAIEMSWLLEKIFYDIKVNL